MRAAGLRICVWSLFTMLTIFSLNGISTLSSAADFTNLPADTPVIPWLRFSVQYAVRVMGGESPTGVFFYITDNGGATWSLVGEDPDLQSPMLVSVPSEGTYGFVTIITTQNRPPLPPRPGTRPETFVIVDRTPPTVRWISPNPASGESVASNEGLVLQWESQDLHFGINPVSIEYSTDGALWLPVRGGLPAVGSLPWNPPLLDVDEVQLRVTAQDLAGNQRSSRTRAKVQFDRLPPQIQITGPDVVGQSDFDVDFIATDESGIANMELYYSMDNGANWTLYGPIGNSPAHFSTVPTGSSVGLYIAAADRKGNRIPAPQSGTAPMRTVTLNLAKPQVEFLPPFNSANGLIDANTPAAIAWNTIEAYPSGNNTSLLEYSLDGGQTWYFVADNLPISGSYNWLPQMEARNVLLRVTVANRFGNRGQTISQFFNISANRPDTNIANVTPLPNSQFPTSQSIPGLNGAGAEILTPNNDSIFSADDIAGMMRSPNSRSTSSTAPTPTANTQQTPSAQPSASLPESNFNSPANISSGDSNYDDDSIPMPPSIGVSASDDAADNFSIPSIEPAGSSADNRSQDFASPTSANATSETTPPTPSASEFPAEPTSAGAISTEQITPEDEADPFASLSDNDIPSLGNLNNDLPAIGGNNNSGGNDDPFASLSNDIPALSSPAIGNSTDDGEISIPVSLTSNDIPVTVSPNQPDQTTQSAVEQPAANSPTASIANLLAQAQSAIDRGDLAGADEIATQALNSAPNDAAALGLLAQVRSAQGKFGEAIELATRASRAAPDNLAYLEIQSYAKYSEANRLQSALRSGGVPAASQQQVSGEVIRLLNDAETAYQQLALSSDTGQQKGAFFRLGQIEYFRSTRILTDDAQSSASIRKAIEYYQKARNIGDPDYREILQIGICNYRLRDYEHAETFLEMAIETATNDNIAPKEAYYYLASIHEKLGRPQQALEFWEKVVSNYPADNQYHQAALKRVEELKRSGGN